MQRKPFGLRAAGPGLVAMAIAGCVLASAGCSHQTKTARHLARAEEYSKEEKHREAVIEYMNVLSIDPTNKVAVRGIGLTLCQMGDVRAAIPYLLKAEKLDPGDDEVRLKLGSFYLIMGDGDRARERAEAVLKRAPGNGDALMLWAAGATSSNEVEAALVRLTKVASSFQHNPKFAVTLAGLHVRKGDFDAAEAIYASAMKAMPDAWEIRLARGDLYVLRGDSSRAGEEYQAAADMSPMKSVARVKLARFCWSTGKTAEARQILDDLLKKAPRFSAAALCRAEIALGERDYATATGILNRTLKEEPSNLEAFLLLQRVKLAQGKTDEAIAAYERLVSVFPSAAQGRYLLGVAWLQKGDVRKAMGECERALSLDADHLDAARLLAELYLRTGQPDMALGVVKPLLVRHSREAFAYALCGAVYGAKKDFVQAAEVYQKMVKAMPGNPLAYHLLGQAWRRLGRDAEALEMFEKALTIDPGFADPLGQAAEIMGLRAKDWDVAVARIQKQIEKVPDAAGLHYLLGNTLVQKKDWEKAERSYQKAIELKPDIAAAYLGLSQVYMATHKEDQALQKVDKALAVNSNDVASLMMKGVLLAGRNDATQAAEQYQRILAVNPYFAPALNNLACLYQGDPSTKDKAYECAKRAREVAPRDPRIADTLGWILYQRGEYKWAMTLLQESAGQMASQAEVMYHLGMCQAALGDLESARASLTRAVETDKTFSGSAEAEAMLSVLSAGDDLKEMSTVAQAEAFLSKYSENPVAMLKTGAFYERTGDYGRARTLYERAVERNGHFVPALMRLADLHAVHLHQVDQAMEYAKQAREEAPGDSLVAERLASIVFQKGDYRWAQSLLRESIGGAGTTPERQYLLGMISYAVGKTDEATNLIGQALSMSQVFGSAPAARRFMERVRDPERALGSIQEAEITGSLTVENLPLLMQLAVAYEAKGERAKARALCEQVVGKYPDFGPAFKRLAVSYAGQKSFSDQEYKVLSRARELLPDDPGVGCVLGEAAYRKGQYDWASRLLREGTARFPERADLLYYLGMSYHQLKNKAAAQPVLKRALELDPQSELAPAARQILDSMQRN